MYDPVPVSSHLPNLADRARLGQLVTAFHSFERCCVESRYDFSVAAGEGETLVAQLRDDVSTALFGPLPNDIRPDLGDNLHAQEFSPALYAALSALLGYFVDLSIDNSVDVAPVSGMAAEARNQQELDNQERRGAYNRLRRVEKLADVVANLLSEQFAETHFREGNIDFARISLHPARLLVGSPTQNAMATTTPPTHRVIRINDIPFAEAVFPELMSLYAHELGYTIEVVSDIAWSEVGAALFTNRIDAAIYNGSIRSNIENFRGVFDHKIIYESAHLFSYSKYVILESPNPQESIRHSFGVPWKSDFEDVVNQHLELVKHRPSPLTPEGHLRVRTLNLCATSQPPDQQHGGGGV